MQEATNTELAAHLAGDQGDRRPIHRLEIDLGDGVWVDLTPVTRHLSVDRSLTGDLPEDAGLIDGYTAAELTADLEGTYIDRAGVEWPITMALSPFVPGSLREGRQLVQAQVRASMGMVLDTGPVLITQFTGPVPNLDGAEGDGTIKLRGVDPSDRLRAPITLPTYAEFVTHAARRPWALTVNTQFLVDLILRANNIFASPPPRDEAIIVCTGHGGLVAERGFNGAPVSIYGTGPMSGLWVEDAHPYGMLGTPENSTGGTVGYQELFGITDGENPPFRFQSGNGVGFSCFLHMGTYMALGADFENRLFQIRPTENEYPRLFISGFGNGDIYAGLTTGEGAVYATPRISTGAGRWKFLGVHFQWTSNTTLVVRVRLGGTLRTYTLNVPAVTITPTPFFDGYRWIAHLRAQMFRAWTNVQLWPSYDPPAAGEWQGETHTAQADIARGLNELLYLPDVTNAHSWELLKAVVAAEYGVHSYSEVGRYRFRPRTDVRPSRVDVELDVRTNLVDAKWSTDTDSVRNIVGITTSKKYHAVDNQKGGKNGEVTVVKADDPLQFVCPVGVTVFDLDWPFGAAGWRGGTLPYCPQKGVAYDPALFKEWSNDIVHGWTYSHGTNWTDASNDRSVVVRYVQTSARTLRLRVSNPGPGSVRLGTAADPDNPSDNPGEPGLRIAGWPLADAIDHVEEVRAPDARIKAHLGERVLPLESSDWRQSADALRPVARQLLDALAVEVTTIEDLEIVGDPRVQVGDVARLRFPGNATPIVGTVVKTLPEADDDGIVGTVSVRPLPAAGLAPTGWVFYIDISRYQGDRADPIDLARVKGLGYAGCVVKIGQGAGSYPKSDGTTGTYGATIDPWWERFRDQARALWPRATAGYWYVGNTEAAADQAARCKAALGDLSIPVMLDWELGGGTWSNLLSVLSAFRAAGIKVTMLYAASGYATAAANGPAQNIDTATRLNLIRARYWTNDEGEPRALFGDITNPATFGLGAFAGGTPDGWQFTQAGRVYSGMVIDVNAHLGDETTLAAMINGDNL